LKVEEFRALPAAQKAAPLVLLTGEERFFREEAIREVEAALGPGVDRVELRAAARGGPEPAAILDELRAFSLFAPRRLVIVRDAEPFIAAAGTEIVAAALAAKGRATLVLDAPALDRRKKAAKEVEKASLFIEARPLFAEPPPWARAPRPWDSPLVDWVVRRAAERGKKLAPPLAWALTRITGTDLFEIAATLEKLDLFLGERAAVTEADIEAVAGHTRRDDAGAVADAIARRDVAAALAALGRAFRSGLEDRSGGVITDRGSVALVVFNRIYSRLEDIRRARAHLDRGGGSGRDAVAAALGIPPFFAQRVVAEAERFAGADFGRIWRELLRADLAVKGEAPGPEAGLERLAVRLCAPVSAEDIESRSPPR
jgi:DNA polymerase-3 subunit delta